MLFLNYGYMLFMTIFFAQIDTHGYPFTLAGDGYGKKLYPLTGIDTDNG
jgi:hypothetical protein